MTTRLAITLLWVCASCANTTLPPRPPPAHREPVLAPPTSPPATGFGRVYFDIEQGPTRIDEQSGLALNLVCVSPCWVNLPTGDHQLQFSPVSTPTAADHDIVRVFERPMVYRRSLGHVDLHAGGKLAALLSVTTGGSLLVTGGTIALVSDDPSDSLQTPLLVSGAVLTALGVYLFHRFRTVTRPGSWAAWPLGAAPSGQQ